MKPGNTRMCTLPFTTPSVEPNGDVRLCSAASTYAYLHETNMGNCREAGLGAVWRNERFQRIRETLLTGEDLTPYCASCEYRAEGPPWMLQLHLALAAFNQNPAPELLPVIARHADRYDVYRETAAEVGLWVEKLPDALRTPGCWRYVVTVPEGEGRIAFRRDDEEASTAHDIASLALASLAACAHGSMALTYRVEGASNLQSIQLRVRLESEQGDVLSAPLALLAPEGTVRVPLASFRSDGAIAPEGRAARVRLSGSGPAGVTVSLHSIEVVVPGDVIETSLNPYRDEAVRQSDEAAGLRREKADLQARLDAMEHWIAPVRRLLALVPAPLRRTGRRLLQARR